MVEEAERKVPSTDSHLAKATKREVGASTRTPVAAPSDQPLLNQCPECGSQKLYKDGVRYTSQASIQRFLCRDCGFRFSQDLSKPDQKVKVPRQFRALEPGSDLAESRIREIDFAGKVVFDNGSLTLCKNVASHGITNLGKGLYALPSYSSNAECASKKAKNLSATETKTVAGEKAITNEQTVKGLLVQFMAWLEKEGYGKESRYPNNLKTLINLHADLLNPENVKEVIGKHNIKNGAKLQYVYAYSAFCKMLTITWSPPHYKQEETLPFVPDETELDALVSACRSKRMAAYLQCLKETYADPGEVLKLRWIDVTNNVVTINRPVKGHNPRQIEVNNKLISMLNSLPKVSDRIFPTSYRNMFACYEKVRKRAAELQKNPRLLSIELRTFRHWGGSMIAHYTNGNVLTVKRLLGHKRIENSMKYISMIHFKDDQFEVTTATTVEEAKQVLSAGFEYVTEKNGIMLFRKPKRFSKYVS